MISDTVAERITHWRKERGWNRERLAEECARLGHPEITHAAITNIESGRRHPDGTRRRSVSIDELMVIAYALDIAPILLIADPENRGTPFLQDEIVPTHMLIAWFCGENDFPQEIPVKKSMESRFFYTGASTPLQLLRAHQQLVDERLRINSSIALIADRKTEALEGPKTRQTDGAIAVLDAEKEHLLRDIQIADQAITEMRYKLRLSDIPIPVLPTPLSYLDERTPEALNNYLSYHKANQRRALIDIARTASEELDWAIKEEEPGEEK